MDMDTYRGYIFWDFIYIGRCIYHLIDILGDIYRKIHT